MINYLRKKRGKLGHVARNHVFDVLRLGHVLTSLHSFIEYIEYRNFAYNKLRYYTYHITISKGADQTAWMRRLVCVCVVCKQQRQVFSRASTLIAYAQEPPLITHYDVSSEARLLNFSLNHHLHPYFVYASGEGSGEPMLMHRLV